MATQIILNPSWTMLEVEWDEDLADLVRFFVTIMRRDGIVSENVAFC